MMMFWLEIRWKLIMNMMMKNQLFTVSLDNLKYHLDKELGQHLSDIIYIQTEETITVQNQHQYMGQLINLN